MKYFVGRNTFLVIRQNNIWKEYLPTQPSVCISCRTPSVVGSMKNMIFSIIIIHVHLILGEAPAELVAAVVEQLPDGGADGEDAGALLRRGVRARAAPPPLPPLQPRRDLSYLGRTQSCGAE